VLLQFRGELRACQYSSVRHPYTLKRPYLDVLQQYCEGG
jgi:hypothetical protein